METLTNEMWQREFGAKLICKFVDKRGWLNARVILPSGEFISVSAK